MDQPNKDVINRVWRVQCPTDVVAELVVFKNLKGTIANLDLELEALVLQELVSPTIIKAPA